MPISADYEPLFLLVLTAVMISDKHIHMDEIDRVEDVYKRYTDHDVSHADIQMANDALKDDPEKVIQKIAEHPVKPDNATAEDFLKAALEVSRSDGKLEAQEQSLIIKLVEALSIPHDQYSKLVQEVMHS